MYLIIINIKGNVCEQVLKILSTSQIKKVVQYKFEGFSNHARLRCVFEKKISSRILNMHLLIIRQTEVFETFQLQCNITSSLKRCCLLNGKLYLCF